jgi:hypothetical protein
VAESLNKRHPGWVEDAKYLTLLSSLKMLQMVMHEVSASRTPLVVLPLSPKWFDEKELYGC